MAGETTRDGALPSASNCIHKGPPFGGEPVQRDILGSRIWNAFPLSCPADLHAVYKIDVDHPFRADQVSRIFADSAAVAGAHDGAEGSISKPQEDDSHIVGAADNPEEGLRISAKWDGASTTQSATAYVKQGFAAGLEARLDEILDSYDGTLKLSRDYNNEIMGYLDDISGDWAHTPGVVDLTHTGDGATVKANIDPQGPSWKEVNAGGPVGIEATDVVWLLWAATVTQTPVQSDTLTESGGDVWTVLAFLPIREVGQVVKWRCVCRKQVS